nr:putative ribonuclease H-like domain-containing protein [Tanacetum cinerariifolium]
MAASTPKLKIVNAADSLVPAIGQISTNSINTFCVAGPSNAAVSTTHRKSSYVNSSQYPDHPNMPELEDITYSDDEEDVGAEADFTNLEKTITVSPIPTTRVHKDHHVTKIIGDLSSATQTRSMTRVAKDQGGLSQLNKDDFHTFARIEAIRLFLAYASFMGFMVYQMDIKSAFLYETIKEEVYVCQPLGFKNSDYPNKVYKMLKALYGLHQAPKAWLNVTAVSLSFCCLVNDVTRLQALVDKKKLIITEATIRDALRLNDAESIDCLPNEEIFTELSRMGVDTTLFKGMIVAQQVDESDAEVNVDDVPAAGVADEGVADVNVALTADDVSKQGRIIADMDADVDVTLKDVADIAKEVAADAEIEESTDVLSMQDDEVEPAELLKVVEVVTTAKLITEVVTAASATIIVAPQLTTAAALTLTTSPSAARRRKGVVIRDPKETATPSTIIHFEAKSKDKRKGILIEEPKPLKKQDQIE